MLKPRGLGRRVAQGPHSFRHSQTTPGKKHIKQNQSLSGFHVIVICFRLSKRIQAPFRTIPGKIRQFQAKSGNFRRNQAFFRHFQAISGRIRQNQAKSGNPLDLENHWSGTYAVPRTTNCSPFLGRVFLGALHQN